MRARLARATRRGLILIPLALTVLGFLLFPSPPPPLSHPRVAHRPLSTRSDGRERELHQFQERHTKAGSQFSNAVNSSRLPWFMRDGVRRPQYSTNKAKLFPEDSTDDDRIVEQLMFTLPDNEKAPLKTILLGNGLGAWGVSRGRGEFIKNKCPVDRCVLTSDSREAGTADAILFKDHFTPFSAKRPTKQVWIMYYLECPYHTASLRSVSMKMFNWTATYRRDSDIVTPYERWVYHDPLKTENNLNRNYAANKTKKVAWFVSNCHARNKRLQYARRLSKHISVDIYGACGWHHCPRADPNCLQMLDKDYKFYLAFENSNCRDYITEKFFVNGLSHDILPIVMGARASEYAAVAPHNSYIHVEEFAGPQELAKYLHRLDKDDNLYNSYFKWKGTGEFINTYFFCRVCAMLHANDRRKRTSHYTDLQAWWRENACTGGDWRGAEANWYKTNEASNGADIADRTDRDETITKTGYTDIVQNDAS